jgi:hypothetical protein
MASRILLAVILGFFGMTTTAALGQCQSCGQASRSIHAGRCYPNCNSSCLAGARHIRPRHGHGHGQRAKQEQKDPGVPAIARFHPMPTRPVFEPRHALPRPIPAPLPRTQAPVEANEPASVLRQRPTRSVRHIDSEPRRLAAPDMPEEHNVRQATYIASPAAPAPRAFAWFFHPADESR